MKGWEPGPSKVESSIGDSAAVANFILQSGLRSVKMTFGCNPAYGSLKVLTLA
jgi:hypothetical protein